MNGRMHLLIQHSSWDEEKVEIKKVRKEGFEPSTFETFQKPKCIHGVSVSLYH